MNIDPKALDAQGYIIDQGKTDNIPFGGVPSSKNGCGWIAVYNFLKAMEQEKDPESIRRTLEKTLLPIRTLGTNIFALAWYIRRQGIPLNVALRPFHAQMLAESCKAGIILYRTGKTGHFAAFRREENGTLRFYGAVAGKHQHDISMADFYLKYVKFPLAVTITAN